MFKELNKTNIQAEWAAAHGDNVYKYMFTFKGIYFVYFNITDVPISIGINPRQAGGGASILVFFPNTIISDTITLKFCDFQ